MEIRGKIEWVIFGLVVLSGVVAQMSHSALKGYLDQEKIMRAPRDRQGFLRAIAHKSIVAPQGMRFYSLRKWALISYLVFCVLAIASNYL